ncbi:FecR family protein [Roseateles sp.]|uniref:FecR family protein n=1 Tax=Roseateles sp. TaxID=1971397 RepID=UPI0039EC67A0
MSVKPLPQQTSSPDLSEQALDWFVRERAGLAAAEQAELRAWLAASPEHARALARCAQQWDELDALPAAGVGRLRHQLAADLEREMQSPWRSPLRWSVRSSWAYGGAAALALAVACATFLAWYPRQQQPLYSQSFSTARGQQLALALPDGSQVRLDTASRGEVALYRERREVRLTEGQAMFQVARDEARPFDVWAGPLRVTVLGTRFAVRYTTGDEGRVRVAVEEGHVRVASARPTGGAAIELSAGQQVDGDAGGRLGTVTAVAADGVAGWREGRLSFENATLAQVLDEFERYGATGLVLKDSRTAALRLTGTFNPHQLENFRRVLPQVLPVRLQPHADQIEIQAVP